jgi:hypothetical protein
MTPNKVSGNFRLGVSEWGSEGREFKSHRPDHLIYIQYFRHGIEFFRNGE